MRILTIAVVLLYALQLSAQTRIVGMVTDRQSEIPLIGANVVLLSEESQPGTITDVDGYFSLDNVAPGRHTLQVSYLGYHSVTLPNILTTTGKEVQLDISLEETIQQIDEVVVTAKVEKDQSNNELATVSSRMFTLEEVTRYSGGRNDASRMAGNFAGVNIANDSRNDIVIRGNSPTGVLWRLEGVPIPNPNHFSTLGTTGGPVSALNTNLLSNSDFLTSAFPSEYGNANAGVFDIQFRSGNRERPEFTAQLSAFSGMEFMAEGPFSKKNNGSFIVSYRHSFVQLAHTAGLDIGTNATPDYRDLTFKVDLRKTKTGSWSFFGIGATSDIDFLAEDVASNDFFAEEGMNSYATSGMGLIGIRNNILLNDRTYIRTIASVSRNGNTFRVEEVLDIGEVDEVLDIDDQTDRAVISSFINKKVNARLTYRAGMLYERYLVDAFLRDKQMDSWVVLRDFKDPMGLLQTFAQFQYRSSDQLTLNGGIHLQYLGLNTDFVLEPRAAINWHLDDVSTLTLGFGVHHQMLPLPLYLLNTANAAGEQVRSNLNADFLASNHYVLGYDRKLGLDWRLKSEVYYQKHYNVPVESFPSTFSVLNVGADFAFPEVHNLVNEGSGENYGWELTLEKFFSKNYYALLTGSLFESKYTGSDGVKRNTPFNNRYILNLLGGKEFILPGKNRNALTFDFKWTTAGGRYYTPIDLEQSRLLGREIKDQSRAFASRFDPYFRLDIKFGVRLNNVGKKISQQFYLDLQNITGHKNVFLNRYHKSSEAINTVYQIGFFPDILYRVQF